MSTCDLRDHATANEVTVVPGGLTRFARGAGEMVVNSGQGGGAKDTWILPERRPNGMVSSRARRTTLARMRTRPLIGVTTSEVRKAETVEPTPEGEPPRHEMALGLTYLRAIEAAGGLPVVIPPLDLDAIEPLLDRLSGICLSGGPDLHPAGLRRRARRAPRPDLARPRPLRAGDRERAPTPREIPMLAICRGTQALNVVRGGTLVQHLPDARRRGRTTASRTPATQSPTRSRIDPDSRLATTIDAERDRRQLVPPPGDRPARRRAWSRPPGPADGTIEAVEDPSRDFLLGVQWHAELLTEPTARRQHLFRSFVEAASGSARRSEGIRRRERGSRQLT